jgi:hypothetical protein
MENPAVFLRNVPVLPPISHLFEKDLHLFIEDTVGFLNLRVAGQGSGKQNAQQQRRDYRETFFHRAHICFLEWLRGSAGLPDAHLEQDILHEERLGESGLQQVQTDEGCEEMPSLFMPFLMAKVLCFVNISKAAPLLICILKSWEPVASR